jgi:hypothetical protein
VHTVLVNQFDELMLVVQSPTGMTTRRLAAGIPLGTSLLATNDPPTGSVYVVVAQPNGHVYLFGTRHEATTGFSDDNRRVLRHVTTFINAAGVVHVAGTNADGDVVVWWRNTETPGVAWSFSNLTRSHLAVRGLATPAFASNLTSYATTWGGMNIAGLDEQGHIRVVWWAPDVGPLWTTNDLSQDTDTPPLSGALAVYLTPWGGVCRGAPGGHVVGPRRALAARRPHRPRRRPAAGSGVRAQLRNTLGRAQPGGVRRADR